MFVAESRWVDDGARGIVEMLFCTSLLALVGAADQPQSSPRRLQIVNTKVSIQSRRACDRVSEQTVRLIRLLRPLLLFAE